MVASIATGGIDMIYVGNIRDAAPHDPFDSAFAIVRNYKEPRLAWVEQLTALSPSEDLYKQYLRLRREGKWNEESFASIYVPQFLADMHNPDAREALNMLFTLGSKKKIALYCYCWNERLCHRSIIAGLLQGAGADVVLPTGRDFSQYYQQYRQ